MNSPPAFRDKSCSSPPSAAAAAAAARRNRRRSALYHLKQTPTQLILRPLARCLGSYRGVAYGLLVVLVCGLKVAQNRLDGYAERRRAAMEDHLAPPGFRNEIYSFDDHSKLAADESFSFAGHLRFVFLCEP